LAICLTGEYQISRYLTLDASTPFYTTLQKSWNDGLRRAFNRLPRFEWELPGLVKDSKSSSNR